MQACHRPRPTTFSQLPTPLRCPPVRSGGGVGMRNLDPRGCVRIVRPEWLAQPQWGFPLRPTRWPSNCRTRQSPTPISCNRDRLEPWKSLSYAQLSNAFDQGIALLPRFGNINTDSLELSAFRTRGGKLLTDHGLADQLIKVRPAPWPHAMPLEKATSPVAVLDAVATLAPRGSSMQGSKIFRVVSPSRCSTSTHWGLTLANRGAESPRSRSAHPATTDKLRHGQQASF